MDTKWLEDFVSLAETQSFSRSAELRHVTQPAFSRRIQSLEAWLGADLIDRTSYPTRLTAAGEVFYAQAIEMLGQISNARSLLRSRPNKQLEVIDFAVPHTLSLTYLPKWLTALEKTFGQVNSRLLALNVHDAVMTLVEGGCDLMLCYHHPRQPVQLDQSQYEMMIMGVETLRAYARCDAQGEPHFVLPGTHAKPLPFLSYTNNAYLDRMVDVILSNTPAPAHLDKRYETDMAEGLKMMALEGHGIAFLPESSVVRELKRKQLARADKGVPHWELEMQIRLYRQRPSEQRPGKALVNRLWEFLAQQTSTKKRRA